MKINCLFLVCILFCLFVCIQVSAQSKTMRELFENSKNENGSIIVKAKFESYRWEKNYLFLHNVKNRLDTIKMNTDSLGLINGRETMNIWFDIIRKVYSQDRINELAASKVGFVANVVCDSMGYVKECWFGFGGSVDIRLEEIELLEKAIKESIKLDLICKTPGIEFYNSINFSCRFVWLANNILESEKRSTIFRRREN